MNYEEHYFAPNGIVTYEDCQVCRAPNMRVEHGKSGRGSLQHFGHCTECGDSMPIVCYDCQYCQIEPIAERNWLGYGADTPETEVREKAAKVLGVPEDAVEVKKTGGCWLARERQEKDDACPRCGNTRGFYRDFVRVQGVWACWYICRSCGHRFDGITASGDALPAGVVARGKPAPEEEKTG